MNETDRIHYTPEVTAFSENELERLLGLASPPVSLLGGWAVHIHVTEAFENEYGRSYIGSRDVDLGVFVDPDWNAAEIGAEAVAETLESIESDMEYNRGRFGFYRYYHRTTSEPLSDDEAVDYPQPEIFRLDIDILPSTAELDSFQDAFGFRPPAEPLLQLMFNDGEYERLEDFVEWDIPSDVLLVPRSILAAMKIRAYPRRDKSHKRRKDLADLHALIWYGVDYHEIRSSIMDYLSESDIQAFQESTNDEDIERASALIGVETELMSNSIQQLFLQ